jgi:hypothetical protein
MNEKLIEKKLRERVKKMNGLALKMWCVTFTGFPDRLVLMPGARMWFVELKTTGKTLSPRQRLVIAMLQKLGFSVWVIDNEETLSNFFTVLNKVTAVQERDATM